MFDSMGRLIRSRDFECMTNSIKVQEGMRYDLVTVLFNHYDSVEQHS